MTTAIKEQTEVFNTMELHKHLITASACVATFGLGILSCVTANSMIDTHVLCRTIKPIEWVDSDTMKTKEQILQHNAVWDCFCDKAKAKEQGLECKQDG